MELKRNILDINGLKVGQAENTEAKTGVTVVLAEKGAVCGVDVRGAAPGTRETDLLDPVNAMEKVQAVVLSGGSAFGLEAASGVMDWLEENYAALIQSLDLTAADLSATDVTIDKLNIGLNVRVIVEPLQLDVVMLCVRKETDLLDDSQTRVSIGQIPVTISKIVAENSKPQRSKSLI